MLPLIFVSFVCFVVTPSELFRTGELLLPRTGPVLRNLHFPRDRPPIAVPAFLDTGDRTVEIPEISVFARDADGGVYRTYSTYLRGPWLTLLAAAGFTLGAIAVVGLRRKNKMKDTSVIA